MKQKISKYFDDDLDEEFRKMCKLEDNNNRIKNNKINSELSFENKKENSSINLNSNEDSYLNKKRSHLKDKKEYIELIEKLIKEGNLGNEYYLAKNNNKSLLDKDNNSPEKNISNNKNCGNIHINTTILYNNPIAKFPVKLPLQEFSQEKNTQQTKSMKGWYQKINIQPPEEEHREMNIINNSIMIKSYEEKDDGSVKFIGVQREVSEYKHFIYLKEEYDIDISIKGKIYEWNIIFLCNSKLIGIGLADKNIVLNNFNKFLSDDVNFCNGVFGLISTFNMINNKNEIHPWNCKDKNLVNYVATFPDFKKGREIKIKYDVNNQSLEFLSKKRCYKMEKVTPFNKKILTPCAIFYYSGDEIKFSEFTSID